jgi:hypothetical protein
MFATFGTASPTNCARLFANERHLLTMASSAVEVSVAEQVTLRK